MRDDHALERQLEQRSQRRQDTLLVPGRAPDEQLAAAFRQRVGEDERPLLRQPERGLVAAAAVVERLEPAGERGSGVDPLELRLGHVSRPEEPRSEGPAAVPADERVDVANVVGLEDDRERRRGPPRPGPDPPGGPRGGPRRRPPPPPPR